MEEVTHCDEKNHLSFSFSAFGLRPAPGLAPPRLVPSFAIASGTSFRKEIEIINQFNSKYNNNEGITLASLSQYYLHSNKENTNIINQRN